MVDGAVDKVRRAGVVFQTFEAVSTRAVAVRLNRKSFEVINTTFTRSHWIRCLRPDVCLFQSRILELELEGALISATKLFDLFQSRVFVIRLRIGTNAFRFSVVICLGPVVTLARVVLEYQVVAFIWDP